MEHEVFISYSSNDKTIADAICHVLEHHGITCWIAPRDVRPGIPYAREIISGIKDCQSMILVFTSHSNSSEHVGNEIDMAFNSGKTIIPFLVDETPMNEELKYYLARKHWLVAYPDYEKRFEELLVAVGNVLGRKLSPINKKVETSDSKEGKSDNPYLKIISNMDCRVLVDYEEVGIAYKDTLLKIPLVRGDYYVQYISTDNGVDTIDSDYSLVYDTLDKIDLLSLKRERETALCHILNSLMQHKLALKENRFFIDNDNSNFPIHNNEIIIGDKLNNGENNLSTSILLFANDIGGAIVAYDLSTSEKVLWYFLGKTNQRIDHITFSHDGNFIAYVTGDNSIVIVETFTGINKCTLFGHKDKINCIEFASNGESLISVSDDGTTRIWDIESASQKHVIHNLLGKLIHVTYSRTGKFFAVLPWVSNKVVVYDAYSFEKIQTLSHKTGWLESIESISFSYDEQDIYACSSGKVFISNIRSGKLVVSKKNTKRFINIIKNIINIGNENIAFSSFNEIYVLNTSTESFPIFKLHELKYDDNDDISCMVYCENYIVSGSSKGYVNVLDKISGDILATYNSGGGKVLTANICNRVLNK